MPSEDDVLPVEEQPLPTAASPTVDSPGYISESDLEEDPEEDDDEDPEEDPDDYPTDRDDDDEEGEETSEDKAGDKDKDEDNEEEDEEHPAPADSVPPPPVHHTTAQAPVPFLSEEEVERFLAIPTPPPSPLTPLSSPLPQIPSPPLLVSPPLPVSFPPPPASPTYPLGFIAAMIRQRAESPSTSHSLPLPSPIILSHTRAPMAMTRAAAPSTYTLAPP
ncbi:hypothetical protein Tco_0906653 [Tanacetum coccineum]|uniref:Uncharacterized protein n=1 Tax=Tanacetum coccineum TaxID=301880 RepID=A0ABQ5CI19_9ASTR